MSEPPVHSSLSPSSAKRWTKCTASPYLTHVLKRAKEARTKKDQDILWPEVQAILPDQTDRKAFFEAAHRWVSNKTSTHAELGTEAHAWAERVLKGQITIEQVPEEFAHIREYTDLCQDLQHRWGGTAFVEMRVPLFYHPKERGTSDFVLVGGDRICIADYKNGVGVLVDAEDNEQMAAYALSALGDLETAVDFDDSTPLEIYIVQPNAQTGDTIKVWDTTVGAVRAFAQPMRDVAGLILSVLEGKTPPSTLEFAPGYDTCRFCPNREICGARVSQAMAPTVVDTEVLSAFDDPAPLLHTDLRLVTPEQLVAIWANRDRIGKILEDAGKYLLEQAMLGQPVPGTKLVAGRQGNRRWIDADTAKLRLSSIVPMGELFDISIKTPTQVAEILKGDKMKLGALDELVTRSDGRPALALENDKRPAISAAADLFAEIADPSDYAE